MFALADCNNFYVSCERLFRPGLNGKPVVVLSNNDGCVIARSDEAKAIGIPMGAVAFEYEGLFKKHGVQVCSSNYALYGDMSARVMHYLNESAPEIEIYSIDEAFLHFGTCPNTDFRQLGLRLREKVLRCTGIPVSIGFAPSKTLAKAGNRIARKYASVCKHVHCIDSEEKRLKALAWLKTEDIWGIGAALSRRLGAFGIHNALAFTKCNDSWVRRECSVLGLRLKYELLGRPVLALEKYCRKQHIACTRSFEHPLSAWPDVLERVATFAGIAAEKLRQQASCCNSLMVFLHTNEHRPDEPQYSRNIVMRLPFPCNSGMELAGFAEKALRCIFRDGYRYKKAGVIVSELGPENQSQHKLFDAPVERYPALMKAVDRINARHGRQKVRLAVQSAGKTFKMRQEHMSPSYTSNLNDIITIHT